MRRLVVALCAIVASNSYATGKYVHVHCDVAIDVEYDGKPTTLVVAHVAGRVINDDHDTWYVDFTDGLPKGYSYLQAPVMHINGNNCLYDDVVNHLPVAR